EGEEGQDEEQEGVYDSQTAQEKMREFTQEPESRSTATAASTRARFDDLRSPKSAATEEDLLRLAGSGAFDVSLTEPSISAAAEALTSLDPSNVKQKQYHNHTLLQEPPALSTTIDPQPASDASTQVVVQDLRNKLHHAHQEIHRQKDVIRLLEQNAILKNQECQFLKTMIKEDLSYIRHKLNENSNIVSNYHSSSGIANSLSRYHHPIAAVEPSNETTQLPAIDESRVPAPRLPHTFFSQNYSPSVANIRGMGTDNGVSSARMVIAASTSVLDNNNNHGNAWDNRRSGIGVSYQHRHSTDHAGLEPLVYNNVDNAPAGQVNNIDKQTTGIIRRVTSDTNGIGWLVHSDVINLHYSWEHDGWPINVSPRVGDTQVENDGHWFFGDMSPADVPVWVGDGLLEGTTGVGVHRGDRVVVDFDEVVIRHVPDIVWGNLQRLGGNTDF
ncbi:hypothetical protein WICPIJ_004438, partial [Wickerhamomyces pijperi]